MASGRDSEGNYRFTLHVAGSNYVTTDIPVLVSVTNSGLGNVLFKISDIYTGTTGIGGQVIQGLSGAKIELLNETNLSIQRTANTDGVGEALFSDITSGTYKCRITADKHEEYIGRVWAKPGVTVGKEVLLPYNLVSVEWKVVPMTIGDKYQVVLSATYETDIPAPVVVPEPLSITLPQMQPGDTYNGEFSLTNHGLVRADHLKFTVFGGGQSFKCELMKGMPDHLEAKERITIPYRITRLSSPSEAQSGAGAGEPESGGIQMPFDYPCGSSQAVFVWNNMEEAGTGFELKNLGGGGSAIKPMGNTAPDWSSGKGLCVTPRPEPKDSPLSKIPDNSDSSCPNDFLEPENTGSFVDTLRGT